MEKKKIMLFEEWQEEQLSQQPAETGQSEETGSENEFQALIDVINGTWSGDVTGDEATSGFSQDELKKMNDTIKAHPDVFKIDGEPGVPFPDDQAYSDLLASDEGAQLIQKMVDKFEEDFDERED